MYVIYDRFNRVETIYHNPTEEQMSEPGMHVEGEIPQADHILGLRAVLKIDVEKAKLYYDYERPDTLESRVLELQKENVEIKYALAELAEAQEKDNTDTHLALTEVAETQEKDITNMQMALAELAEMSEGGEK
ncbi:hypothetical protein [Paenibacillus dendritiformis]|uniref:Uncharacterized protein n=1 Tax=Paenibacillus dendritiformis C454 TaxID=1131935 RepID=H3SHH5_9BACL|nr:hypothetical protein [Paenibacillus dendritiformis]EHQ61511.1 hypothetical protein PDENDC454_14942 [Paenibacillus dendritiformis C454]CAH8772437.1 hypothetical protein H7S4_005176 [Paenibacillus dendritiformis]